MQIVRLHAKTFVLFDDLHHQLWLFFTPFWKVHVLYICTCFTSRQFRFSACCRPYCSHVQGQIQKRCVMGICVNTADGFCFQSGLFPCWWARLFGLQREHSAGRGRVQRTWAQPLDSCKIVTSGCELCSSPHSHGLLRLCFPPCVYAVKETWTYLAVCSAASWHYQCVLGGELNFILWIICAFKCGSTSLLQNSFKTVIYLEWFTLIISRNGICFNPPDFSKFVFNF